jgi:hypothetical protein
MTRGVSIDQLLRWRLALAESEAAVPPSATHLLQLARPWWERWPDQFRLHVERLKQMPLAYGYAMANPDRQPRGYPVPAIITQAEDLETYARVLYLNVRDCRLRIRFQLATTASLSDAIEATFVSDGPEHSPFSGQASLAQSGEYRMDVELPASLCQSWAPLRVTDRMPFRLILRPAQEV